MVIKNPGSTQTCGSCTAEISTGSIRPLTDIFCPHCDHPTIVPYELDHFHIHERAGRGCMGEVFKARDKSLDREVALKLLYADDEKQKEQHRELLKEARAAASLNHDNAVKVSSQEGHRRAAEAHTFRLGCGTLAQRLEKHPVLLEKEVLRIASATLGALEKCHEINLIHGDLKPGNLMYHHDGTLKLCDFGIAHFSGNEWKADIRGTPLYIAPEKAEGEAEDDRSDLYSLGVILWRLLAGRPPFDADDPMETVRMRFDAPPPDVREHAPDTTRETGELLLRMMDPDPARRIASYPEIHAAIADARKVLTTWKKRGGSAPSSSRGGLFRRFFR